MRWILLAIGVAGCGNPFRKADDVAVWANAGSAVAVYSRAYQVIGFADGQVSFADPACPATSDDGATVVVVGGCTDSSGASWLGSATIVRSGADDLVDFDRFGSGDDPSELSGSFDLVETAPTSHDFHADLIDDGGVTMTIAYDGSVEGDYDTPTTWNGSGHLDREGPVAPTGEVDATTVDELLDDSVCSGQAVSGKSTFDDGKHQTVITYDGATDCDDDHAARWTVDGEDRGLITGIVCATGPGPGSRLALVLAALLARRAR